MVECYTYALPCLSMQKPDTVVNITAAEVAIPGFATSAYSAKQAEDDDGYIWSMDRAMCHGVYLLATPVAHVQAWAESQAK